MRIIIEKYCEKSFEIRLYFNGPASIHRCGICYDQVTKKLDELQVLQYIDPKLEIKLPHGQTVNEFLSIIITNLNINENVTLSIKHSSLNYIHTYNQNKKVQSFHNLPSRIKFHPKNYLQTIHYTENGKLHRRDGAASITTWGKNTFYTYYYNGVTIPNKLINDGTVDPRNITETDIITLALLGK